MATYYTIQTKEKWIKAQELGYLEGEGTFVYEDYVPHYKWLSKQMKDRLPNYNSEYPIWLWLRKPNLEHSSLQSSGKECVCLTVELEKSDVLLSDFQAWNNVLMDSFISLTWEEDELFEDGKVSVSLEESWERIFDIESFPKSEVWNDAEQELQGTTGKINIDKVIRVEEFIAV